MSGKVSGLGSHFYLQGYDLSGDTSALDQISGGPALLDVTGINKQAHERIGALRDGSMQFTSFFNNALLAEHAILSQLPRTDVVATFMAGGTLGNPCACLVAKQANYDPTRDNSGALTEKVQLQANGFGLEWGIALTAALRTDTAATTGIAVDNAAATTFGAQAYLQVNAFTGTSVDIKVEHSADSSTWATLIDFGAQSAVGAKRQAVTGTVNRYVRATTGTGTFSSVTFLVAFVRNPVAVSF